jgi:hypothetical protein
MSTWARMNGLSLALLAFCSLPVQRVGAQEESALGDIWGVYAKLNYSSWDGLGDVQPLGRGGPFETSGVGIDFGGYTSIARMDSVWLLAGGELGFLGLNSDVIFEDRSPDIESAFEVNHITGAITARFGQPGGRYFDLGIGLGRYYSDTKYIDCSVILRCFSAETGDSATAAYLEVGGTPGKGVLLGARIHFVDFDPIEAVDLAVNALDGPIYSIFVGWEYSNWRRN